MSDPKRIQRKPTKGWRTATTRTVYVGRPSTWGNPFEVGATFTPERAVDAFVVHLSIYFGWRGRTIARAFYPLPVQSTEFRDWLAPLRGRDLACWCGLCPVHADGLPLGVDCPDCPPCHASVLLDLANSTPFPP